MMFISDEGLPTRKTTYMKDRQIYRIPVGAVQPNPNQPRKTFADDNIQELASSIRQYGLLQPISVRRTGLDTYELIAGERRLRACGLIGETHIDAIIITAYKQDSAVIALIENLQRENLTYMEEAEAFDSLIREYGFTQEELSRRLGKSQSSVANKLRILRLEPEIKRLLRENDLTERHARALLKLKTSALQHMVLSEIISLGLNVRQTEQLIDHVLTGEPLTSYNQGDRKKNAAVRAVPPPSLIHCRDIRPYLNSFHDIVRQINAVGLSASIDQQSDPGLVSVTITIELPSASGNSVINRRGGIWPSAT